MPLTLMSPGEDAIIQRIGGKPEVRQHLENLNHMQCITEKEEISMKTLRQVKVGETVTVVKLHGEGAVKRRIMDMGITKGVQVYVRKVAPLGDPVEVNVRGYELSIRKNDAEMIEVQ